VTTISAPQDARSRFIENRRNIWGRVAAARPIINPTAFEKEAKLGSGGNKGANIKEDKIGIFLIDTNP
jgi:hypothetical protein